MLVLSRKPGEKIRLGADIVVTVVEVRGHRVRLGIEAPSHVPVLRSELQDAQEGSPAQAAPAAAVARP